MLGITIVTPAPGKRTGDFLVHLFHCSLTSGPKDWLWNQLKGLLTIPYIFLIFWRQLYYPSLLSILFFY